jgi:RNA polymerase sigma factor (sigma-70 family)
VSVGVNVYVVTDESSDLAYERAYATYWRDVFRFALAWTNDWAAAEDLAQDAFARLWRARGGLDWDRPILPWLLVTTRRLAADRFRALRRRIVSSPTSAPDDDWSRARWLDLRAAMATLSPLERTALVMTALEGWSYTEAATSLGTTPGALRAAVSRARDKLEAS